MTNKDLETKARQMKIPLVGVFSKDLLLTNKVCDGGYIINMQDSVDVSGEELPGTHWVCFFIERGKACYFDSFGFNPPAEIQLFLKDYTPFPFNKKEIQNLHSGWCGDYCLFFLSFMFRHQHVKGLAKRLDMLCERFDDDPTKNLKLLKKYMHLK